MKIETLQDLFVCELATIYDAEMQILKALPRLSRHATHPALRLAFENHLSETRGQIDRLEQVFTIMNLKPKAERCESLRSLMRGTEDLVRHVKDPDVMDAALIAATQKVELFEVAAYGTLVAMAELLGYSYAATLLAETLEEEHAADAKLNEIALQSVNNRAQAASRRHAVA